MTRRRAMFHVGGTALVMDFDLASSVQKEMSETILAGRDYENATSAFMRQAITPGDTCVDVGAHVGFFTLLMAALVGPTGRVYAFEPNPDNYQRLLNHLSINGLRNVIPLHMAVGSGCGVVDLWVNKDNDGGHALYDVGIFPANTKSAARPQRYPVWCTTLDALVLPPIAVLKVDTEGAEHGVLKGCTTNPGHVVSEIHRAGLAVMGSGEDQYRRYMTQRGYGTTMPDEHGHLHDMTGKTVPGSNVFNVVFTHGA